MSRSRLEEKTKRCSASVSQNQSEADDAKSLKRFSLSSRARSAFLRLVMSVVTPR